MNCKMHWFEMKTIWSTVTLLDHHMVSQQSFAEKREDLTILRIKTVTIKQYVWNLLKKLALLVAHVNIYSKSKYTVHNP